MDEGREPDTPPRFTRGFYRGMNPTIAILGLGAVFLILAVLMISRSGHDDARPPPNVPKSTSTQ